MRFIEKVKVDPIVLILPPTKLQAQNNRKIIFSLRGNNGKSAEPRLRFVGK